MYTKPLEESHQAGHQILREGVHRREGLVVSQGNQQNREMRTNNLVVHGHMEGFLYTGVCGCVCMYILIYIYIYTCTYI